MKMKDNFSLCLVKWFSDFLPFFVEIKCRPVNVAVASTVHLGDFHWMACFGTVNQFH